MANITIKNHPTAHRTPEERRESRRKGAVTMANNKARRVVLAERIMQERLSGPYVYGEGPHNLGTIEALTTGIAVHPHPVPTLKWRLYAWSQDGSPYARHSPK